jgi:REP element-mobilizing transposase RayT
MSVRTFILLAVRFNAREQGSIVEQHRVAVQYNPNQTQIMANTYSQINLHIVFAVKNRQALIQKNFKDEIEKYITGIVKNHNCKLQTIFCNPDHTHLLIGLRPNVMISDLVKTIKTSVTALIKEKYLKDFGWQDGYGVFSYSNSQVNAVAKYILNQAEHHKKRTFKEEYLDILNKANVDFDDKYLFEFFD